MDDNTTIPFSRTFDLSVAVLRAIGLSEDELGAAVNGELDPKPWERIGRFLDKAVRFASRELMVEPDLPGVGAPKREVESMVCLARWYDGRRIRACPEPAAEGHWRCAPHLPDLSRLGRDGKPVKEKSRG